MEWSSEVRRKRHPTDDLNEEQPLSKRLSLLNLNYGNFPSLRRKPTPIPPTKRSKKTRPPTAEQERMDVDSVVYVSDLDSDSDSGPEEKVVFLPDIERKLNKVPYQLASNRSRDQSTSTELVLYSVPSSISVPETKDVVRRAIIESRQRLREKSAETNLPNGVLPPMDMSMPLDARSNELSNGGLGGSLSQAAKVVESPSTLPTTWNEMPDGFVGGSMNGRWGAWTPLHASEGIGLTDNYDELDAMEIE